jgi:glucans biosynthesis protein
MFKIWSLPASLISLRKRFMDNSNVTKRNPSAFCLRGMAFALTLGVLLAPSLVSAGQFFGFEHAVEIARRKVAQPYAEIPSSVPRSLADLDFQNYYGRIHYRPDKALWAGTDLPFQVQMFHPGHYFTRMVKINVIDEQGVRQVPFDREVFQYLDPVLREAVPPAFGYAGVRIHSPLNVAGRFDDLIAFLGGTYFRALGKGQHYGLSARGVALDTAEPGGEEFPHFTEFWLVKPAPGAQTVELFALSESRRLVGAHRFTVRPGDTTQVDCEVALFFRGSVNKLGIAPLTSMFFFGENTAKDRLPGVAAFHPEVHDSDGLSVLTAGGEWIYRPLTNPQRLVVSSFATQSPRGFGLVQRDRDFDHYRDLKHEYERRPSLWIEPLDDWGTGRVELVQIPTDSDQNDNIVAYWVPERAPKAGDQVRMRYRQHWYADPSAFRAAGGASSTWIRTLSNGGRRFVVSFTGPSLAALDANVRPEAFVTVGDGRGVSDLQIRRNPYDRGYWVEFTVPSGGNAPLELRAYIKNGNDFLTETWSYLLEP